MLNSESCEMRVHCNSLYLKLLTCFEFRGNITFWYSEEQIGELISSSYNLFGVSLLNFDRKRDIVDGAVHM